jgi:hypothetical protein
MLFWDRKGKQFVEYVEEEFYHIFETGFKDKFGTDILEGSILLYDDILFYITYEDGLFMCVTDSGITLDADKWDESIVVGHILTDLNMLGE